MRTLLDTSGPKCHICVLKSPRIKDISLFRTLYLLVTVNEYMCVCACACMRVCVHQLVFIHSRWMNTVEIYYYDGLWIKHVSWFYNPDVYNQQLYI